MHHCHEHLCVTYFGSLWIVLLRVVQEGRHIVVQISLKTVDQVPTDKPGYYFPFNNISSPTE